MNRMVTLIAVGMGIVGLALLGGERTEGQVVVLGGDGAGPGGKVVQLGEVDGVQPLVWQLRDDAGWAEAKAELIEKAGAGERIEVVHALLRARQHQEEKVQVRIDAVLGSLEESGLYPLTRDDVRAEAKQLKALIEKIARGAPNEEVTPEVLMTLVHARRGLERAQTMIETGELPEPAPRSGGGRVILRPAGGE